MNSSSGRKYSILGFFGLLFLILIAKLFHLQLIDQRYKIASNKVSVVEQKILPSRGMIYDRKDSLVVFNVPVYDIYITRSKYEKADSSRISAFLQLSPELYRSKMANARSKNFWHKPYPLVTNLSEAEHAEIQEELYKYPALSVQANTERRYTYPNAALLFGYMGKTKKRITHQASIMVLRAWRIPMNHCYVGRKGSAWFCVIRAML